MDRLYSCPCNGGCHNGHTPSCSDECRAHTAVLHDQPEAVGLALRDDVPKIQRAGKDAVQPYVVRFTGSTRRFMTKERAADAIADLESSVDPRTRAAYDAYRRVKSEVHRGVKAAVLAANADVP